MTRYDKTKNRGYESTYWNHKGKYQSEFTRLFKKLVPSEGRAPSEDGELLRCISRFYHDRFNNGHGNSMRVEMKVVNRFLNRRSNAPVKTITYDILNCDLDNLVDYILEYLTPRHPIPKEYPRDPRAGLATLMILGELLR